MYVSHQNIHPGRVLKVKTSMSSDEVIRDEDDDHGDSKREVYSPSGTTEGAMDEKGGNFRSMDPRDHPDQVQFVRESKSTQDLLLRKVKCREIA